MVVINGRHTRRSSSLCGWPWPEKKNWNFSVCRNFVDNSPDDLYIPLDSDVKLWMIWGELTKIERQKVRRFYVTKGTKVAVNWPLRRLLLRPFRSHNFPGLNVAPLSTPERRFYLGPGYWLGKKKSVVYCALFVSLFHVIIAFVETKCAFHRDGILVSLIRVGCIRELLNWECPRPTGKWTVQYQIGII